MSNLSNRTLTKKISRPNARKALTRIEEELRVLIMNSARSTNSLALLRANVALCRAMQNIHTLYAGDK